MLDFPGQDLLPAPTRVRAHLADPKFEAFVRELAHEWRQQANIAAYVVDGGAHKRGPR